MIKAIADTALGLPWPDMDEGAPFTMAPMY